MDRALFVGPAAQTVMGQQQEWLKDEVDEGRVQQWLANTRNARYS